MIRSFVLLVLCVDVWLFCAYISTSSAVQRRPTQLAPTDNVSCAGWNGKSFAVSFSWDDGNDPQVTYVPSLMASVGVRATFYVAPFFLDPVSDKPTPDQLDDKWAWARASYVTHEVGGHTLDHLDMSDRQLNETRIRDQFVKSNERLTRGFRRRSVDSFAWPFGRYSQRSLAISRSYYENSRTTSCRTNERTNTDYLIHSCELSNNVEANVRKAFEAREEGSWLIFHGHGVNACAPMHTDWVDIDLDVRQSKHKNAGTAKSQGKVTAMKNVVTGEVRECRHGWKPIDRRSVEKTMHFVLALDPFVDTVGSVFRYRKRCV